MYGLEAVTPFDVRPETRQEAGKAPCLRDEVVSARVERGSFVQFSLHRGKHQDRHSNIYCSHLPNQLNSLPSPGISAALQSNIEFHKDRIEWRSAVTIQGRFKRMGYFNSVPK